jgi:hypothetical protein
MAAKNWTICLIGWGVSLDPFLVSLFQCNETLNGSKACCDETIRRKE